MYRTTVSIQLLVGFCEYLGFKSELFYFVKTCVIFLRHFVRYVQKFINNSYLKYANEHYTTITIN
jgi:hypothetical protein